MEEQVEILKTIIESEEESFVTYDITSYPSDLSLKTLVELWDNGDVIIPDFQREFVWKIKQSSLLIDSFLLGLPVPPIFFYIDEENKSLVIDGQQRLLSVIYYYKGYFGAADNKGKRQIFSLSGLNKRSPFYNKKYEDLEDKHRRKLDSSVLRVINIRQLSPSQDTTSVYHIFERLNTGGTPLKPQEIRNCVFRGKFLDYLKELNNDANWRIILGQKIPDKHQSDVELLLRVFGLSTSYSEYTKPMKEFLNRAVQNYKNYGVENPAIDDFDKRFKIATKVIVEKLGEKPFHLKGPLNSAAMDSVLSVLISNYDRIPTNIDERYKILIELEEFKTAISASTTDDSVLKARFSIVEEKLL